MPYSLPRLWRACALIVLIGVIAAGCASSIPDSSPLAVGAPALPPNGYAAYCERASDDPACAPGRPEADRPRVLASTLASPSDVGGPAMRRASPTSAGAPNSRLRTPPPAARSAPPSSWTDAGARRRAPRGDAPPRLTTKLWAALNRVNTRINNRLSYASDQRVHAQSDVWSRPLSGAGPRRGVGDCEDFALEKRHALRALGVPDEALSIAVALLPDLTWHAVLVVSTDRGDYVLDNRYPDVRPWRRSPYYWAAREHHGRISDWRMIAAGPPARR